MSTENRLLCREEHESRVERRQNAEGRSDIKAIDCPFCEMMIGRFNTGGCNASELEVGEESDDVEVLDAARQSDQIGSNEEGLVSWERWIGLQDLQDEKIDDERGEEAEDVAG